MCQPFKTNCVGDGSVHCLGNEVIIMLCLHISLFLMQCRNRCVPGR
jgi:hypothetical protein